MDSPAYFLIIPSIFYTVIAIVGVDFATLRESGWVFDVGCVSPSSSDSALRHLTFAIPLFDPGKTSSPGTRSTRTLNSYIRGSVGSH